MALDETTVGAVSDLLATDDSVIHDMAYAPHASGYAHGELVAMVDGVFTKIDAGLDSTTSTYVGTGNGLLSDITVGAETPAQTFTITCSATAVNGGTFTVVGSVSGALENATVGVPYSNGLISFDIADGTTDFVATDAFSIVVSRNKGIARAVCYAGVGINVAKGLTVVGGGVKSAHIVGWTGLTTAQKNKAKVDLFDRSIYVF